jgi:DNA-binding MarR family transcriptional regulator
MRNKMTPAALTLEQFAARLVALLPRLSRGISQRDVATLGALTLSQLWALEHLLGGGPCTMCALAAELQLQGSTATGLVDQLMDRGLAVRRRGREDRRVVRVALTAKGRRYLEQMHEKRRATLAQGFRKHTRAERVHFLKSVEKLVLGLAANAHPAARTRTKDTP